MWFLYVAKCFPEDAFAIVGDGPYRKEIEVKRPKNVYLTGYMVCSKSFFFSLSGAGRRDRSVLTSEW